VQFIIQRTMQEMKSIPEYPMYSITKDGKVWSHRSNKFLAKAFQTNGYTQVSMCKNGKVKSMSIHRLMGLTYLPNPEGKPEIDHINGKPFDNRVENLRWCTSKENKRNQKIGLGYIGTAPEGKKRFYYQWHVHNRKKCRHFFTMEEAIAYRTIIYNFRCLLRKKNGQNY